MSAGAGSWTDTGLTAGTRRAFGLLLDRRVPEIWPGRGIDTLKLCRHGRDGIEVANLHERHFVVHRLLDIGPELDALLWIHFCREGIDDTLARRCIPPA